jgi:tight adherence protein B
MTKHFIVYLLVFVSAALLSYGAYVYYSRERKTQEKINRRISVVEAEDDRASLPGKLRRERSAEGGPFQALDDFLTQTGVNISRNQLLLGLFLIIVVMLAIISITFGPNLIPLAAGVAAPIVIVFFILRYIRNRRIAKFEQQLPDAIDVIVRSLRAGHPFPTAMSLVAKELPDPVGTEFTAAFEELTFGLDMRAVMSNFARRVGSPDLRFLVTSVTIQSQSGGNLAEILSRLSSVMRERATLRHKIKAMTAEARASAGVMTLLPVGVVLAVGFLDPTYYGEVWDNPSFRTLLYVAGALLFTGNVMMRQMAQFKF